MTNTLATLTKEELLSSAAISQTIDDGTPVSPIPDEVDIKSISGWTSEWVCIPYQNEDGHVLFYIARSPNNKGLPWCWYKYTDGREDWKNKQPLAQDRPLLNLPKIIKHTDKPIMVVEGEKTALAAQKLFPNHVVTTSSGGAQAAAKTDWSAMCGRDVIICPDNDEAGQKYANDVYDLCKHAGAQPIQLLRNDVFASYAIDNGDIVEQKRELPKGWDLADAKDEGWIPELIDKLQAMLQEARLYLITKHPELTVECAVLESQRPTAMNIKEFLEWDIPPRGMILNPIIPEQGLVMLFAPRGVGKTYVSLTIAYTVASGSVMFDGKWSCDTPRKVLFVDGEMPASVLQERMARIIDSGEKEIADVSNLHIITPDLLDLDMGMPDLSTREGQQFIEAHLGDVKLLILDNLSALCRTGRENDSESWLPMQEWFLSLRKRGISVLIIHHTNKNGTQRGNSKKEDLLDTVIELKKGEDYSPENGAQFEVHYQKARGFFGEDARPFEAHLMEEGGKTFWKISEIEDLQLARILSLAKEGMTQRKIAQEMNMSLSKVNRLIKKSKESHTPQ